MTRPSPTTGSARIGLGFREFVITIALMTASIALAIDSMLPAPARHCRCARRAEPK